MALRKIFISSLFYFIVIKTTAQGKVDPGILTGNLLDEKQLPVQQATVQLINLSDTFKIKNIFSDISGQFKFESIPFGYYQLRITHMGFKTYRIDSIYFRSSRFDFNLNDLVLHFSNDLMEEVIFYAEKPLIENKQGNIVFNAGESPLSASSNASDLLKSVPLIASDPNGKITLKGKEPRVLIDDKPVELNAQQLQDFLESLPGSMIEKIEVMTNPPAQYAGEPGGVINIVTRKGKVGKTGRMSASYGTRGETLLNGSYSYRKKGIALNVNAGWADNLYQGSGYSKRQNILKEGFSYYNTENEYHNTSHRPSLRIGFDYDLNVRNIFNAVLFFNENDFTNKGFNFYGNYNNDFVPIKLSERNTITKGQMSTPNLSLTYTLKQKNKTGVLKFFGTAVGSFNNNSRNFFQQYFNPDYSPNGIDSTMLQNTQNNSLGYTLRISYDKQFANKKTSISTGAYYNYNNSKVDLVSQYFRKSDSLLVENPLLSNHFKYNQTVSNIRFSIRQLFSLKSALTVGLNTEWTTLFFELMSSSNSPANNYPSFLPFLNYNLQIKKIANFTFSYRRTIRRPGITELNPSIDYGDPYNLRFGNPFLKPSTSHTVDILIGKTHDKFYFNMGAGFNLVQDIYAQIRTLQPDGKTFVTWQNIDDRKEYEWSTWGGYTFSKKVRVNLSTSYTYNIYSKFDKEKYKYRDGGSFTSNLNGTYIPNDFWNANGSFTFNKFANPQGFVRWNISMNLGVQRKFMQKRLLVTLNIIDPLQQQKNRIFTYGTNFIHESYSISQTKNYRITLGYNFIKVPKPILKKK